MSSLPDEDHLLQALTPDLLDLLLNKIEEFITGVRHRADPDRALATIMFTDMVRSTEPVPEMGDSRWRELLNDCYAVVRNELTAFRGREVNTAGDGLLANPKCNGLKFLPSICMSRAF
jgi:class 3 adenylate cyclase